MYKLNQNIKLLLHDKILAKILLNVFPPYIKPNHITFLRFIFTPLVFYLVYKKMLVIGLISFILVAFTDVLDGSLARVKRQITVWGITYDPLADKILISGIALILIFRNFGMLLAFIVIILELIIVIGATYFKYEEIIIPATILGKIKMILQVLSIFFLLTSLILKNHMLFIASYWFLISSIVFASIFLFKEAIKVVFGDYIQA